MRYLIVVCLCVTACATSTPPPEAEDHFACREEPVTDGDLRAVASPVTSTDKASLKVLVVGSEPLQATGEGVAAVDAYLSALNDGAVRTPEQKLALKRSFIP